MKSPSKKPKQDSEPTVMLSVWVPKSILQALDDKAKRQDTDRSKLVRRAIRSTLQAS